MKRSLIMMMAVMLLAAVPAYAHTGHWSEPVPVDSINGVIDDFYPSISPDGQTLYFTTGNRIRASRWTGTGWGTSYDLGPNINRGQRQVKASVTPDNRTLYFTSWAAGGIGTYDIWKSNWDDSCQCWGAATVLPPPINTEFMEWDVQLSYDGRTMYLSSDRHFSWGREDIWYTEWNDSTQNWGEPLNLGLAINTSAHEYGAYPNISGDELYFCSWAHYDFYPPEWQGAPELYKIKKVGDNWDSLCILTEVNSPDWEESPALYWDGSAILFASSRPGGPGFTDIYISYWQTGIDTINQDGGIMPQLELDIFPNPARDVIFFRAQGNKNTIYSVDIFNILGQRIHYFEMDSGSIYQ